MRKTRSDKIELKNDLDKIERMASLGLSIDQIAGVVGCSSDTIYRRLKEGDTELSAAILKGRSEAILEVSKKCFELALEGDVGLIKYILSCKGGWTEKTQVFHEGGRESIKITLSNDQLERMAKEVLLKIEEEISNEK